MDDLSKVSGLEDELEGPVLAVFMMATYGEGDPTDNAQEFYDWLQAGGSSVDGRLISLTEHCTSLLLLPDSKQHVAGVILRIYPLFQLSLLH